MTPRHSLWPTLQRDEHSLAAPDRPVLRPLRDPRAYPSGAKAARPQASRSPRTSWSSSPAFVEISPREIVISVILSVSSCSMLA